MLSAQTDFDVAEAFAIGELRESQTEELIPTRKVFDVTIAVVAIHADLKLVGRDELQELSENRLAEVQGLYPGWSGKQPMVPMKGKESKAKNFIQATCFLGIMQLQEIARTFTGHY